jgi:protein-tyrosine phosphatase
MVKLNIFRNRPTEANSDRISILFVCTGNICRSPTAEGVFRHHVEQAGLAHLIAADSAGTHAYHLGEPPDSRSQAAAARRRYDLSRLRARQVTRTDFDTFDFLLAMDNDNLAHLHRLGPPALHSKAQLFLDFATGVDVREVPDPYYGAEEGFDLVLDLVEDASHGLLAVIRERLRAS